MPPYLMIIWIYSLVSILSKLERQAIELSAKLFYFITFLNEVRYLKFPGNLAYSDSLKFQVLKVRS